LLGLISSVILISSLLVLSNKESSNPATQSSSPYLNGIYNASQAKSYFNNKPVKVLVRSNEILSLSLTFALKLLFDYFNNKLTEKATEEIRARELTNILNKLGPTFIKVGQSLSIRRDLLRPSYLTALSSLQDQVPPFDSKVAVDIIEKELGAPIRNIFLSGVTSTEKVIAAASLGQVYRARLLSTNTEVAVKVQRPDILETVALDMHILREAAPIIKKVAGLQSDLVGIVGVF